MFAWASTIRADLICLEEALILGILSLSKRYRPVEREKPVQVCILLQQIILLGDILPRCLESIIDMSVKSGATVISYSISDKDEMPELRSYAANNALN